MFQKKIWFAFQFLFKNQSYDRTIILISRTRAVIVSVGVCAFPTAEITVRTQSVHHPRGDSGIKKNQRLPYTRRKDIHQPFMEAQ